MGMIKQSINEGMVRGLTGKEEDTAKARLLESAEPLPNEMKKIKKCYLIAGGMCLLGIFFFPLLDIGITALIVLAIVDSCVCDKKLQRLRRFKFKYNAEVGYEELFMAIQPVLMTDYGMTLEKRKDGVISINCKDFIYDLIPNNDCTFTLWWRTTLKKMRLRGKYEKYKIFIKDMGIIAYTIQQAASPKAFNPTSVSGTGKKAEFTDDVFLTVKCEGCGAENKIKRGSVEECEFCGAQIKG